MKVFNTQQNISKAKHVLNFHDGVKTNLDGSPFWDMRIFKNKKELEQTKKSLILKGYIEK